MTHLLFKNVQGDTTTIYHCLSRSCEGIPKITFHSNQDNNKSKDSHFITVICTKCNSETKTTIDEYIKSLLSKKPTPKYTCTYKDSHAVMKKKATRFCYTCNNHLCSECVDKHSQTNKQEPHKDDILPVEITCAEHSNSPFVSFCLQCKKHLCSICAPDHDKAHNIIELNLIFNYEHLKAIDEDYRAIDLIYENCLQMIEHVTNKLNSMLQTFKEASDKFIARNYNYIKTLRYIFSHYKTLPNNYYSKINIVNNSNINISNCELNTSCEINEENISYLINYFNNTNFHISSPRNIEMSNQEEGYDKVHFIQEIKEHKNWVYSLITLSDGRLASCSADRSIKVYTINDNSYKLDINIEKAHGGGVDFTIKEFGKLTNAVTFINEIETRVILSCGDDCTIRLWELGNTSYKHIATLEGHSNWINKAIKLTRDRFASCSVDGIIKIWNANSPYNTTKTLRVFVGSINSIIQIKNKEILVACGEDKDVDNDNNNTVVNSTKTMRKSVNVNKIGVMRTLDLNGYKKIQKMKGVDCCFKNGLIELDNNLIAVGGKGVILLVDYMKWEKIKVIESDFIRDVNVYSIVSQFNILLCGCGKGKFCQIDLNTGDVNYGLVKMHDKNIFALALLENNHIASGSYDNTIRIWKYELE